MPIGNPIRKQNESRMVSVLATNGQTVFTVQGGYIINHISVFRNGVRLSHADDYTAGDGSTVTLNEGTNVNDRIDFHIFDRFTVQNAIIGAASTQTINGDLVLNGKLFGALDVPSINLTGIVTATELDINGKGDISSDLTIARHLNVTGISTFKDKVHLLDSDKLHIGGAAGDNGDLQLFHDGSNSYIEDSGTGNLFIESNSSVILRNDGGGVDFAKFINGGGVELYHNNVERLTTTYSGADVTGTLNVTGISTFGGQVNFNGDINLGNATSDTITVTGHVDSDLNPSGSTRDLGTSGVEWRNLYTSDGVIASDTISSHASDSDTKIRFPTVDTVSVETAGTERVRINSSGLIGIGTNNPLNSAAGARVNIYFKDETTYDSTTNRANGLIIHNTASGGYSSLELAQRTTSGNTYGSAIINAVDPSNGNQYGADLTFQTRETGSGNYGERMRIIAGGQVGIGTISPGGLFHTHTASGTNRNLIEASASHAFLRLKGGTTSHNSGIEFYSSSSNIANITGLGGGGLTFEVGGSERLRIDSNGNLGLGDDGPTNFTNYTNFSIHGAAGGAITFGDDGTDEWEIYAGDGALRIYDRANTTERLRITDGGLIGVNQNSPSFTMDLKRAGTDIIRMNNSGETTHGNADAKIVAGGTYYQNMDFHAYLYKFQTYNGSSLGERLRITKDGQVLIGTDVAASFNGVGQNHNLIVAGSSSDTDITDNYNAAITISNTDGTANNTAGLHFAREDTDGNPHYTGAAVVAQFQDTMNTGQYPKADLAFLTSTANNNAPSQKMRLKASGEVLSTSQFISKTTAEYNASVNTASGFTDGSFNVVLAQDVLDNHSVYIVNFSWNHQGSGQPYLTDGAFVFQVGATNPGSAGAMGPTFTPVQGSHTEQGTSKFFTFRYYSPTGSHTHGLQAAFNGGSLNDSNGNGALQIKIFKIGAETTI